MVPSQHFWSSFVLGLTVLVQARAEPSPAAYSPRVSHLGKRGDSQGAASGFSADLGSAGGAGYGAPSGHDNFFMYANVPNEKEYEFGYRRGNDQHFQERYEKAGPSHNFKTKVRWGDKKGGYGEHYYDYNHVPKKDDHEDAGHGGADEAGGDDGYGGHSQPIPDYKSLEAHLTPVAKVPFPSGKEAANNARYQRQTEQLPATPDAAPKKFKKVKEVSGEKLFGTSDLPQLVFDWETGRIVDEKTGRVFVLQPVKA